MNILLIGGTGFLGRALIQYFLADDKNFIVSIGRSNLSITSDHFRNYNISITNWDNIITELQEYKNWVIIDLAYSSVPNTSFENPVHDFSENLGLINKHLTYAGKIDVLKYVYVSSGGTVYGTGSGQQNREDDPNFPLSPYGITKMASERYVYMHYMHHGLNINIVRPSNVYGPGQLPFRGQGFIATALGLALKKDSIQIFGDGSVIRDYIYIKDVCTALSDIIHFGLPGEIYNIGSGNGVSLNELVGIVNVILNEEDLQLNIEYLPERKFDVQSNILNNGKLSRLNNWTLATPLDTGIRQTWEWIKSR